jgi:flagellar secretion chaperone FliS
VDDARIRYLRDRVMTATPAQRVVMLFDRLALDLQRALACEDELDAADDIGHATTIVAELLGSLDQTAGGPADNLAALYTFLLRVLTAARCDGDRTRLVPAQAIVAGLRDSFAEAAAIVAGTASVSAAAATSAAAFGQPLSSPSAQPARAWVG